MKRFIYNLPLIVLLLLLQQLDGNAQTLKRATGGNGIYKEKIWWFDFTNIEIAAGDSVTQTYNINNTYTLVITIDNISFGGLLLNNMPLSSQRLIGYQSGTYGGDGLVGMYNIGVPNNANSTFDRAQNTLTNALSLKFDGNYFGTPNEATANFRVRSYAYINGSNDPVDVGLVFASAETDEPYDDIDEYSKGTTNGTPWSIIETALNDLDGAQNVQIGNGGMTATTRCGFNGFTWAMGNVIIMYTQKNTTSISNRLDVDMEFKGGGSTATAIGFILPEEDLGDAPVSYGNARHLISSTLANGLPPTDDTFYISQNGLNGMGQPILPVGTFVFSTLPRLGLLAGDVDNYEFNLVGDLANMDNTTGLNDEDAITSPIILNTRSTALNLSFDAYTGNNQTAYVNAWFDKDKNSLFDAGEFKSQTIQNSQLINFEWANLNLTAGTTYLRLRVQTNVLGDGLGASNLKVGGEVEDYRIDITTFITGNIYNDGDGLNGTTNTVDGVLVNNADNTPLYVSLIQNGVLISQVPVNQDGSYEFNNIYVGDYTLVLTDQLNGITPRLPTNWTNVGEFDGIVIDNQADGIVYLSITDGSVERNNVNFGINKRPISDNLATTINQPLANTYLTIGINNLPMFAGFDLEDGIYSSLNGTNKQPQFIIIDTLPTNGTLYYNNALVSGGDTIFTLSNGELKIQLTGRNYLSTTFYYSYVDAAGSKSVAPASYLIEWGMPLPVKLLSFDAEVTNTVILNWITAEEMNNKGFYVQHSTDGNTWVNIGFVESKHNNSSFQEAYNYEHMKPAQGNNYYRLYQIDLDGRSAYSKVVYAKINHLDAVVYPTPAKNLLHIDHVLPESDISIYDINARLVKRTKAHTSSESIDVSVLQNGVYILSITSNSNIQQQLKIVIER